MENSMKTQIHRCHAIGCSVAVEPEKLMCRKHWSLVPRSIQAGVLNAYKPGQCRDWSMVSKHYLKAAKAAINAVNEIEKLKVARATT